MNTKLHNKLQRKRAKVLEILNSKKTLTAHSLGQLVFKKLKGSYGVTMNPYPNKTIPHSQFRLGFNTLRKEYKLKTKPKIKEAA